MKNMVLLYKTEEGDLYCQEITEKGVEFLNETSDDEDHGYWDDGGTIIIDELDEILDKERGIIS